MGVQGRGDQIWHGCGRSQAHQLPLMDCHQGDIPFGTESDNAESKPCPSGDFKGPHFLPDAITFISSGSVRCSEEAPVPLGSVPGFASDLLDALGKAN